MTVLVDSVRELEFEAVPFADEIEDAPVAPLNMERLARMASIDGSWWQDRPAKKRLVLWFPRRSLIIWAAMAAAMLAIGYFGGKLLAWVLLDEALLAAIGIR